eukprot:COSAG02_NODE_40473_length_405_cov_0.797386_1_plen_130_part_01
MALAASQAPDVDDDLAAALKASMSESAVPSDRTPRGHVDEMSEEEMLKLALEQSAREAEIYAAAFADPEPMADAHAARNDRLRDMQHGADNTEGDWREAARAAAETESHEAVDWREAASLVADEEAEALE